MEEGKDNRSAAPEGRTRSNEVTLQECRLWMNSRRNFLMVKSSLKVEPVNSERGVSFPPPWKF